MRHVGKCQGVFVPAECSLNVEALLHPNVWVGAKEEQPVYIAHKCVRDWSAKLVGQPAAVFIREQHHRKNGPVAPHVGVFAPRLANVCKNECQQNPGNDGNSVDGNTKLPYRPEKYCAIESNRYGSGSSRSALEGGAERQVFNCIAALFRSVFKRSANQDFGQVNAIVA